MTQFELLNEIGLTLFLKEQVAALSSKTRQTSSLTELTFCTSCPLSLSLSLLCIHLLVTVHKNSILLPYLKTLLSILDKVK